MPRDGAPTAERGRRDHGGMFSGRPLDGIWAGLKRARENWKRNAAGSTCDFLLRSVFHFCLCLTQSVRSRYFTLWLISHLVKYVADELSATFAALSDPTRRAILARLSQGELSVKELSEPFSIAPPSMTKHLKVLERAGLISRSRDAQKRPCRLESAPLRDVDKWLDQYRRSWEHSMNRLDEYLGQLEAKRRKEACS